jgi:hypothetical protein
MTEDRSIPGHTLIEIFQKYIKHNGKKNIKSAQMQALDRINRGDQSSEKKSLAFITIKKGL